MIKFFFQIKIHYIKFFLSKGAGGTGNVIKEIIYPMGAKINIR